ncbi:uncharacterized protein LOC125947633 [Dermacentor silvarum]|uniref:uncharacterized protein LOC125947633 n=1 Tax=Dermacentor silvarum TaxID=543639 RepID=UPI0021006D38|nr:uncharacterized protein LOC125947633 [Dermacentor silvarum]XP_049528737.1 uncharacterized protein LOC125947633 [Dermacentor silvarum]
MVRQREPSDGRETSWNEEPTFKISAQLMVMWLFPLIRVVTIFYVWITAWRRTVKELVILYCLEYNKGICQCASIRNSSINSPYDDVHFRGGTLSFIGRVLPGFHLRLGSSLFRDVSGEANRFAFRTVIRFRPWPPWNSGRLTLSSRGPALVAQLPMSRSFFADRQVIKELFTDGGTNVRTVFVRTSRWLILCALSYHEKAGSLQWSPHSAATEARTLTHAHIGRRPVGQLFEYMMAQWRRCGKRKLVYANSFESGTLFGHDEKEGMRITRRKRTIGKSIARRWGSYPTCGQLLFHPLSFPISLIQFPLCCPRCHCSLAYDIVSWLWP